MGTTSDFFRKRDAWRKHPVVGNNFRRALPGFGTAVVAFGIYLFVEGMYEKLYKPESDAHHH